MSILSISGLVRKTCKHVLITSFNWSEMFIPTSSVRKCSERNNIMQNTSFESFQSENIMLRSIGKHSCDDEIYFWNKIRLYIGAIYCNLFQRELHFLRHFFKFTEILKNINLNLIKHFILSEIMDLFFFYIFFFWD